MKKNIKSKEITNGSFSCGKVSNATQTIRIIISLLFLISSLFLFVNANAQAPLTINEVLTLPYCEGSSTGSIKLAASGGYTPYTFQMISPTIGNAITVASTYSYDALTAATYIFKITDNKGNSQNRTIVLDDPIPVTYTLYSVSNGYMYVCDSIDVNVSWTTVGTKRPNYTYEIWKNTNTAVGLPDMTIHTSSINPTIRVPLTQAFNGNHFVRMTDSCGKSTTFKVSTYSFNWATQSLVCNQTNLNISYKGLKMPATFQLFSDTTSNATPIQTITQTNISGQNITFNNLPSSGYYRVIATDACGYIVNQVKKVNLIIPKLPTIKSTICNVNTLDSSLTMSISLSTLNAPWTFTILNGPTTYQPNKFSGSLINPNITYPISTTSSASSVGLYNLPVGTYQFAVIDACGFTDTVSFQVNSTNISSTKLSSEVIPGCLNANTIRLMVNSCNANSISSSIQLTDATGKVLNSVALTNDVTLSTPNLPAGTYYANLLSTYPKKNIGNSMNVLKFLYPNNTIVEQDTIIVYPYVLPSVPNVQLAPCPNTNLVSFIPTGANGITPYSFELLGSNINNTVLQGPQTSDTFSNLATGQPYRIRITDFCGNATVTNNVTGSPLYTTFKMASTKGKCFSIGDSTTLFADSLTATIYNWNGPNGFTATGRLIKIDSLTRDMTGMYKVIATTAGACTNIDSLFIGVGINAGTPTSICVGDTILLKGIPIGGNWFAKSNNIVTSLLSATNAGVATASFPGNNNGKPNFIYQIGSCADTTTVTINALPTIAPIVAASSICEGSTTSFTEITNNGVWNSTNSNVASINTSGIVKGLAAGNTTISYSVTDANNCSNIVTKEFSVNATTYSTTTDSICKGKSYTFNGVTYSLGGTYSAHLTNSKGCDSIATLQLKLNTEGKVGLIQGDTMACINNSVTLTTTSVGGIWSSIYPNIATVKDGIVIGKSRGMDSIQYSVLSKCGNITISHPLAVLGQKPSTDTMIKQASCLYPQSGSIKLLVNGSESPYKFEFNGTMYHVPYTIPNLAAGTYAIKIYNSIGCPVDSFTNIEVTEIKDGSCDTLYVPTGFLPTSTNNNGYVRILKPFGGGSSVRQLTFRVYNRNGNMVFESHDINKGWNGTLNGTLQDTGTYVWYLEYLHNNKWMSSKGISVLIR
ncbi:gliding motility-associated C-terminal domain-containing protein [Parasediminibacterium sp. JCM 36343]|uniref:T9SS type B sorting domain-containing protein n=1 Tax=Parasediminibacterium sp. JCM 36343 TaxID=3374279 RepID=UPI00397BD136